MFLNIEKRRKNSSKMTKIKLQQNENYQHFSNLFLQIFRKKPNIIQIFLKISSNNPNKSVTFYHLTIKIKKKNKIRLKIETFISAGIVFKSYKSSRKSQKPKCHSIP